MDEVLRSLADGDKGALERLKESFSRNKTPTGMTSTPFLNELGRRLGRMLWNSKNPLDVVALLWNTGSRDFRIMAISALGVLVKRIPEAVMKYVSDVVFDIDNWEICDQMALRVVGPLAVLNRDHVFRMMDDWFGSENRWLRRLSVATIPPYIRKRREDVEFCLDFLRKTMGERDKDVIKAIGRAFREISKKDPESVFQFLLEFSSTGDRYRRRIIREGMQKLPPEYRNRLVSALEKSD